jgi:hypothetical protein
MVGELERTGSGRFQTLGLIRGEAVGGGGTEEQGKDRTNCQAGRSQVGRADETYGPRSVLFAGLCLVVFRGPPTKFVFLDIFCSTVRQN